MNKIISVELLNRVANALASMTGLSYIQVQGLLNEIGKLPDVPVAKEEKK